MRDEHRHVMGLLLVFALLGLVYSTTTPLFEAPDEAWHYAYVRYIVETRALPALTDTSSSIHQEVAQPPLYYALAALVSGFVPDDDLEDLMWHNPGFGYQAGGTANDNKNMLIHTERERFPWQGAVLAVRLARLVSTAFGLLTVVAAWGLGRECFPQHPVRALTVAGLVVFSPQFLFISGVVNNDTAAAALSTSALWAIAHTINRGATHRRSLVVGILVGLAALTKISCLLLGFPAVIGLMVASFPRRRKPSVTVGHLTTFALATLATGGWWYLRNAILYHDPFALQAHVNTPWGRAVPASFFTLVTELPQVYRSFWGGFGWGHVEFPSWVYLGLGVVPLTSLIGWNRALKKRHLPGRGRILLLAGLWGLLVFVALLQWMHHLEAPHGRLLFPAIGAGALLLVGGWTSLSPLCPEHHIPFFTSILLASLAILSLLTPILIIRPAFAPPRLLSLAKAAGTVEGPIVTYGDTIRRLGVTLDRTSVSPGGTLQIRVCWEALAPMTTDYTVFVHLIGRKDQRVAERHTYPGLGRFPTSLWHVGDAFCDAYRVRVEEWAPAPEMYDLVVGIYDASTGKRLVARDSSGATNKFPSVGQVRVAPANPLSETPEHPLDYQLGEQITLTGYRLSGSVQSNSVLTVTLYWRADAPPTGDYRAFVHLLDEGTERQPLAQHDGPPRYGRYPTSAWHTGDIVADEHILQLPVLPTGQKVRLVTGMYQAETLDRLPVQGSSGPMPNDLIPLPLDAQ
jgi:4-amino-4-deoxy-L-arabinose transferase-like glycosyltransferase